jgi:hypothetical protein
MYFDESEDLKKKLSNFEGEIEKVDSFFEKRLNAFSKVRTTPSQVEEYADVSLRAAYAILRGLSELGAIERKSAVVCEECDALVAIKDADETLPATVECGECGRPIETTDKNVLVLFVASEDPSPNPTPGRGDPPAENNPDKSLPKSEPNSLKTGKATAGSFPYDKEKDSLAVFKDGSTPTRSRSREPARSCIRCATSRRTSTRSKKCFGRAANWSTSRCRMDDLTEEKARQMEAGEDLDRVCAGWLGIEPDIFGACLDGFAAQMFRFSTDWSAAGALMEAMGAHSIRTHFGWECWVDDRNNAATAPTPQLAIARACAVLVALGVTREEVEGE